MARKKKLDLKGLNPKAQAVAKDFITVEVFVYAKVSEKKVAAKKVFFQVPAAVAEPFVTTELTLDPVPIV